MKKIVIALLSLLPLLLVSTATALSGDRPLPKLEHLTAYGCSVELMVPESVKVKGGHWHAYVWAEHGAGNRDWKMLYSQHQGKRARRKCLDDCDAWMRGVDIMKLRSSRRVDLSSFDSNDQPFNSKSPRKGRAHERTGPRK